MSQSSEFNLAGHGHDYASDDSSGFDLAGGSGNSSSDFALGGDDNPAPRIKRRRAARERDPLQTTSLDEFCVFVVSDSRKYVHDPCLDSRDAGAATPPAFVSEVAGVMYITYRFRTTDEPCPKDLLHMQTMALEKHRRATTYGFLDYECSRFFLLAQPFDLIDGGVLDDDGAAAVAQWMVDLEYATVTDGQTVPALYAENNGSHPLQMVILSPLHVDNLANNMTTAVRVNVLTERQYGLIAGFPTKSVLTRWRRLQAAKTMITEWKDGSGSALLYSPQNADAMPQRKRKFGKEQSFFYDPVRMVKAIKFSEHLHTARSIQNAVSDAIDYALDDDVQMAQDANAARKKDPNATTITRNRVRLDPVAMLLTRRKLRHIFNTDKTFFVSGHLYTDGSPVTGQELQGMVLQLMQRDGTMWELVMPGVALTYGKYGLADKTVAFCWSLFLLVGADMLVLEWVLGLLKSVTTDMGTELGFVNVPNVMPAFMKRLTGAPMESLVVGPTSRLLPRALQVPGWSHLFGNLMKLATKCVSKWPEIRDLLGALCYFLRNLSWRQHVAACLVSQVPNVEKRLAHFDAHFAKWRYETLYKVFNQCLLLRDICETFLVAGQDMFPNFREGETLNKVLEACQRKDLRVFLDRFSRMPLSRLRRSADGDWCAGAPNTRQHE